MSVITKNKIIEDLKKQYYSQIDLPINNKEINLAVDNFLKFLQLDNKTKNTINFDIAPNHRRGEIGYRNRKSEDHIYNDDKEFFHYHPLIIEKYSDFLTQNEIIKDFIQSANQIWQKIYEIINNILLDLDEIYPGCHNKIFCEEPYHIQLRFLKYSWHQSGKYLAKPHFDCGAMTLAIAESDPGLRIGSCPEDIKTITHEDQKALLMLSANHINVFNDPKLKASWHDVIQLNEQIIGKPYARWAVVAFIEAHGVKAPDRNETHKYYKM